MDEITYFGYKRPVAEINAYPPISSPCIDEQVIPVESLTMFDGYVSRHQRQPLYDVNNN